MRRLLKVLFSLAAVGGAVALVRSYLKQTEAARADSVQLFFDDGTNLTLQEDEVRAQEFEDIAHKIMEASHS